jgi:hypothetical protein
VWETGVYHQAKHEAKSIQNSCWREVLLIYKVYLSLWYALRCIHESRDYDFRRWSILRPRGFYLTDSNWSVLDA